MQIESKLAEQIHQLKQAKNSQFVEVDKKLKNLLHVKLTLLFCGQKQNRSNSEF